MQKQIIIYTDGACSGNPGKGGWSAILMYGSAVKEIYGCNPETTNNRMELTAVIEALRALKRNDIPIEVYSDSAYVVNAFNQGWLNTWVGRNWITKGNKPVQNTDLWMEVLPLLEGRNVIFHKVQGHADNQYNNRCDFLAKTAIADL